MSRFKRDDLVVIEPVVGCGSYILPSQANCCVNFVSLGCIARWLRGLLPRAGAECSLRARWTRSGDRFICRAIDHARLRRGEVEAGEYAHPVARVYRPHAS